MKRIFDEMIAEYGAVDLNDRKNAVKEVMQEIVLCGLSRAGFFERAAFYGGTALRIFYGLDRFSEDLDFSLRKPDQSFDMETYFPVLRREVEAAGLDVTIESKQKSAASGIKTAYLRGNFKEHILMFYPGDGLAMGMDPREVVKIKLETDVDPPLGAKFETRYRLLPSPYEISLYDMPSLFAGKIDAVLRQAWKSRIKGRDLYDYIFYLQRGAAVNIEHLRARLQKSGYIQKGERFDLATLKEMLNARFDAIDYDEAKRDVLPFVRDAVPLGVWSAEFFKAITHGLTSA